MINRTVLAFLLPAIISACSTSPQSNQQRRLLRALNGKDFRDTLVVEREIPQIEQVAKSRYRISYRKDKSDKRQLYINQFLKPEYKLIALESSDECMIGQIQNILTDDSLIFVYDGWHENVFVFNLEGKFINRIGRKGHARNEYTSMKYVTLDRRLKQVCLRDDYSQKLLFYDYQGHFLNCEPMYFWYDAVEIYEDKRVMLTLPYPNPDYPELEDYRLILTNGNGEPIGGALANLGFPKYSLEKSKFRTSLPCPMHTYPDGVYFVDILSPDTIWRISDEGCEPILSADFGEPFSSPKVYSKMTNEKYWERINEVPHLRDNFIFTQSFGFVSFGQSAIIDLKSGEYKIGRVSKQRGNPWQNLCTFALDLNLDGGMYLFKWDSDQFVRVLYADDIIKHVRKFRLNPEGEDVYQSWPQSDHDILNNLSMEDNPVLIVGTFKEFRE